MPEHNVDHVFNLNENPPLNLIGKYDLIITSSTLEHVTAPWKAAACLESLLKPGGLIYISVPWIWRYHAYPNDYWRFNRHTLEFLFHDTHLVSQAWSTSPDCKLHPYSDTFDNEQRLFNDHPHKVSLYQRLMNSFGRSSIMTTERRKYLPYLMIHQLRVKQP